LHETLLGVFHDLYTPITVILATAQLLQQAPAESEGDPGRANRLKEMLRIIEVSAKRLERTTQDLLEDSRLQAGRPVILRRDPVDLVALARQVVDEHRSVTTRHAIQFAAESAQIAGNWDASRIERTLSNLLANAIKYSPGGGQIDVTVSRFEDTEGFGWASVSVSDSGVGIAEADLPFIFNRYWRSSNVEGRFPGTGIGLATSQRIVELHGGEISVSSTPGKGTTFTVTLPLDPAPLPST
jgi:signal transduction histidine kinase